MLVTVPTVCSMPKLGCQYFFCRDHFNNFARVRLCLALDLSTPKAKPFDFQKLKEIPEDKKEEYLAKAPEFLASEGCEIKEPEDDDQKGRVRLEVIQSVAVFRQRCVRLGTRP